MVIRYAQISSVLHLLPEFEASVIAESFASDVSLQLRVPREHEAPLRAAIGNATHGKAVFPENASGAV